MKNRSITFSTVVLSTIMLALSGCGDTQGTPDGLTSKQKEYLETCKTIDVGEKSALAFSLRSNGVSQSDARKQLGSAKAGTVGYIARESALAGAYSTITDTANEAVLAGLTSCVERFTQANGS